MAEDQRSRLMNWLAGLPRITLWQTIIATMMRCWHRLGIRRLQYWGRLGGGSITCFRTLFTGETSGPEKGSLYSGLQSGCVVAIKAGPGPSSTKFSRKISWILMLTLAWLPCMCGIFYCFDSDGASTPDCSCRRFTQCVNLKKKCSPPWRPLSMSKALSTTGRAVSERSTRRSPTRAPRQCPDLHSTCLYCPKGKHGPAARYEGACAEIFDRFVLICLFR